MLPCRTRCLLEGEAAETGPAHHATRGGLVSDCLYEEYFTTFRGVRQAITRDDRPEARRIQREVERLEGPRAFVACMGLNDAACGLPARTRVQLCRLHLAPVCGPHCELRLKFGIA